MSDELLDAWLAARRPAPPSALARRLREVLAGEAPSSRSCRAAAEALLARLLDEDCAVRDSALDLLVADSLVTYAFEIAADDPTSLEAEAELSMRRIAAFGDEHVVTTLRDHQGAS